MPSSPDVAVRWEPAELVGAPSEASEASVPSVPSVPLAPVRRGPIAPRTAWSFEQAFPDTPVAAPEPFVVSERIGIPAAVLAEARRAARSEGYAAGFASGVADARERAGAEAAELHARAERDEAARRADIARALSAVHAAAADLAARDALALAEVEQLVVDSAFALAEAVIGTALRDDDVRGAAALLRALALVPDADAAVTVALHPADLAVLADRTPAGVTLVADPALVPGDAVARTGDTTVDARLGAALDRAREVLGR